MPVPVLDPAALARDLAITDLTDPVAAPGYALQLLVDDVTAALAGGWGAAVRIVRSRPIVSLDDNYDRLAFPSDAVTRDARYSRYVSETCLLRTHTSALVPPALRRLAGEGSSRPPDVLLACPGLVYRRDAIDRLHTGTPHQLDLWRVTDRRLTTDDLLAMIASVVDAALPGRTWRAVDAVHPYTEHGLQIDVAGDAGDWIEVGECGMAAPAVLAGAGLAAPERVTGLAMGLGLDRLLMLRKGVPDIRLLRSDDPRVAAQMKDLAPYRPVSNHPAVRRDLSVAIDGALGEEELGDLVRDALGAEADAVEAVEVVSDTPEAALPEVARRRLGSQPGQRNLLLRIVLRRVDRTLTDAEANELRDRIYAAVHRGANHEWALNRA